jgi:hypothetical protein
VLPPGDLILVADKSPLSKSDGSSGKGNNKPSDKGKDKGKEVVDKNKDTHQAVAAGAVVSMDLEQQTAPGQAENMDLEKKESHEAKPDGDASSGSEKAASSNESEMATSNDDTKQKQQDQEQQKTGGSATKDSSLSSSSAETKSAAPVGPAVRYVNQIAHVSVLHRRMLGNRRFDLFGKPFIVAVDRLAATNNNIYALLTERINRYDSVRNLIRILQLFKEERNSLLKFRSQICGSGSATDFAVSGRRGGKQPGYGAAAQRRPVRSGVRRDSQRHRGELGPRRCQQPSTKTRCTQRSIHLDLLSFSKI